MVIKPNHKNVDAEGMVYLPYLFNWNPNTSNLRELITLLCGVFGQEPPLFSRVGPAAIQSVQATPITSYQSPPPPPPFPTSRPVTNTAVPTPSPYDKYLSPPTYSPAQGVMTSSPTAAGTALTGVQLPDHLREQQTARERERLVKEVTGRLQEEILMTQTRLKGEIDEDLHTQFELSLSRERVEKARRDIITLREQFQSAIG
jgi:ESCRT-I complex subunit TSG101